MTVRTNNAALAAQRNLSKNQIKLDGTVDRVSSGKRINKVSVDSAGFAVATKITADLNTLNQAMRNASQASSVAQVATGAMNQVSEVLQRMKTLSSQVVSGALSDSERSYANAEYQKLISQIDNTASQTLFNGIALVNGGSSTVTTTTANVAPAIVNPGASTIFANSLDTSRSMGYIEGQVTKTSVTALDSAANVLSINVTVGSQTFEATYSPTASTAGYVSLVSTSNDKNVIALTWNSTASWNASSVQADLETLFGTVNGNYASVNMSHNSSAAVSSVAAPTGGVSGVWMIQGSGTDFSATDGVSTYTASAKNTNGAQTVTFGNGLALNLSSSYTTTTDISNFRVSITAGTNQSLTFQVGQKASDTIDMTLYSVSVSALGLTGTSVDSINNASTASLAIDAAITTLNTNMAQVGAVQSQFETSMATTAVTVENLTAARGAIEDADLGHEMTEFAKYSVLTQMASAMLAQANQIPQYSLRLMS